MEDEKSEEVEVRRLRQEREARINVTDVSKYYENLLPNKVSRLRRLLVVLPSVSML